MLRALLVAAPVVAGVLAAERPAPAPHGSSPSAPGVPDARELFLANCALCHGAEGDGQGVADLDRKARSFKDGGFSYGNTPETVQRTIRTGIPGTPMPAFGEALDAEQVAALADYVISLGPGLPPEPENSELVVVDRPTFVRGMLPAIAETGRLRPRGLLLGYSDGFTFEYRVDDVRLLGVRLGRFVDRTDWVGRGGTPLKPLGQVVTLVEGGDPRPAFSRAGEAGAEPLRARLVGTELRGAGEGRTVGVLRQRLDDAAGAERLTLEESIRAVTLDFGSAYRRTFAFTGGHHDETLEPGFLPRTGAGLRALPGGALLAERELPGGGLELVVARLVHAGGAAPAGDGPSRFTVRERELVLLDLVSVQISAALLPDLAREAIEAALLQELDR
jgi:mono/diheme cytochrome c family protein